MAGNKTKKQNAAEAVVPKDLTPAKLALTALLLAAGIAAVWLVSLAGFLGTPVQWLVAILALMIIGMAIRQLDGFSGFYGMYMLATEKGLQYIDGISHRYKDFWLKMSMWGLVLGFGLMAYPLLKGRINKGEYAFGIVSLIIIMVFVLPFMQQGLQFIYLPSLQSAVQTAASSTNTTQLTPLAIITYVIGVVTGFTGYIVALLFYITGLNGMRVFDFVGTVTAGSPNPTIIQNLIPGVAPLIPGITIPLAAGLIALVVLLIVHELSHGILSRIYGVKLKSLGLLMLGAIPIGAFVEPNEKQVMKLDPLKQTMIFVAGASTNFFAAIVFFLLMIATIAFLLPGIYSPGVFIQSTVQGYPAANVLQPGMQVLYWNGYQIKNLSSFGAAAANDLPGHTVTVVTNKGTYSFNAISVGGSAKGYIGVNIGTQVATGWYTSFVEFIYAVFVLSFILNFSVAVVNLLPVPLFDGWRVYKASIRNNNITKALAAVVGVLLLINVAFLIMQVSV